MAKESGRQCKKCGFAWYAAPPKSGIRKVDKPRWYDEGHPFSLDPTGRMNRRVANYDREQRKIENWAQCPNCGSSKVKSPSAWDPQAQRSFEPTGRIVQKSAPALPAQRPAIPASSPFAPLPPRSAASHSSIDWEPLKRWYLRHWRLLWMVIFVVAPFASIGGEGTYTHSIWLNVLQFIGTLAVSWALAAGFFVLHRRRKTVNDAARASAPTH